MRRLNHESTFLWQAQYLVMFEVTSVAPSIVNDVSYVTRINHESHVSWQAQHLVSFFVAGAVFGEI